MIQTSYVMVKPGFANSKKVINEIIKRFTINGLEVAQGSYIKYDKIFASKHYHEHIGKNFYPELEQYITSDKAFGMKVVGENAISKIRALVGATKNPEKGTIRYDIPAMLNMERRITENVVHASDSEEAAKYELTIFSQLKNLYNSNEK